MEPQRKGRIGLALLLAIGLSAGGLVTGVQPAAAASWASVGSNCANGGVSGWSFYNACWGKQKLSGDSSSTYDYFQFKMTVSGNSTDGKYMDKMWVEPYRSGGSTQAWEGSDPFDPDQTTSSDSNCRTETWSISGGAPITIGYSTSQNVCTRETQGPKLYADAGHHAGIWTRSCSDRLPSGQVRKTSALVNVRVSQGGTASWATDRKGINAYSSRSC